MALFFITTLPCSNSLLSNPKVKGKGLANSETKQMKALEISQQVSTFLTSKKYVSSYRYKEISLNKFFISALDVAT